jgi:hypothetical protein
MRQKQGKGEAKSERVPTFPKENILIVALE